MARVDVLELKSFQKISLNEVSDLSGIGLNKCQPNISKASQNKAVAKQPASLKNKLKSKFNALSCAFKSALHNLLYETVPLSDTYSPE